MFWQTARIDKRELAGRSSAKVAMLAHGSAVSCKLLWMKGEKGLLRELNPGPLAPEARIIPLDQAADSISANAILFQFFSHMTIQWRCSLANMTLLSEYR